MGELPIYISGIQLIYKGVKLMKKITVLFVLLFLKTTCFSETLIYLIQEHSQSKIAFCEKSQSIEVNLYDKNEFYVLKMYEVTYEGETLSSIVTFTLNKSYSEIISRLRKYNLIKIDASSNINDNGKLWQKSQTFINNNSFSVKQYIRDTGNGWSTDDFGFLFQITDGVFSMIDLKIFNIYSTYIEKGGYTTLWNREKVTTYKDQKNLGIQFYYLMEESVRKVKNIPDTFTIYGILNDEKVRLRESPNLDSSILRVLNNGEKVSILECENEAVSINGQSFPWLKVVTDDGKLGYVFGQYLTVLFN